MAGETGQRKIKLFCPSVSKIVELATWKDQKLDFRAIASAFGLEPATVKLNGHFISRGLDLIATCVTWQSLLSYFSAKGLYTGKYEGDALLVDGKLSKLCSKKRHHCDPLENLSCKDDLGPFKTKKLKDKCSVGGYMTSGCNKRNMLSENSNSLKKLKLNMEDSFGGSSSKTPLKCNFMSDNGLKRTREDDMIASVSCKKKCNFMSDNGLKRTREDDMIASGSCKKIR